MSRISIIRASIIALTLLVSLPAAAAARKGWESVKNEPADTRSVVKEHEVEIRSASGLLVVATNKPLQIKVFTILGRMVSNETLQPGTSQLTLPAHGVYVVQAGDLTCKIAV